VTTFNCMTKEVTRLMLKKITTVSILAVMATMLCVAQGTGSATPGTPPDPQTMIQMRVNMLTTLLGLTDTQKNSATTIFTNAFTASDTIRTTLEADRQALAAAVKANEMGNIETIATTIGTATGQLASIQGKADALFYSLLTADQQAKFDALPHGGPGRWGPGGPGGFGGPAGFAAQALRRSPQQ
jgi:Spy/CpxP family protein refolding chaperone